MIGILAIGATLFVAIFGSLILLALAIGGPRRRSGGSATTGQTTTTATSTASWIKTNKLIVMIVIMIALLVFSAPWLLWVLIFSDWWLGKTLVVVIFTIIVVSFCEPWSEESQKKLIKRLALMAVVMAIASMTYQKANVNADDLKGYLAVPTKFATSTIATITTPSPSPTPKATAAKTTANKGKGTLIPVPGKVAGDKDWKNAYIFQLKSGHFRFQWDIEGPMGWEVRDEKTGKVYSDVDVKDPNKKVPIPQNGWVRIRAKGSAPLQVTVYTYW